MEWTNGRMKRTGIVAVRTSFGVSRELRVEQCLLDYLVTAAAHASSQIHRYTHTHTHTNMVVFEGQVLTVGATQDWRVSVVGISLT